MDKALKNNKIVLTDYFDHQLILIKESFLTPCSYCKKALNLVFRVNLNVKSFLYENTYVAVDIKHIRIVFN